MQTKLIKNTNELIEYRNSIQSDFSVGLVPTMGALHQGHGSLIKNSKKQNDYTIVSVFVNPTQFGENEDFDKYPRDLEKDFKYCQELGVDVVFSPSVEDMYPIKDQVLIYPPKNMAYVYEGFIREGHFDGVLMIVMKLFNLARPTHCYFGQKDAQQLLIIKRMIKDTFFPTKLIPCPIQRDFDGLALSSRNIYLTKEERKLSLQIPSCLQTISKAISQGEVDTRILIEIGKKEIYNLELEYLDICNHNLECIDKIIPNNTIVLMAAKVGKTRLLDNLWV